MKKLRACARSFAGLGDNTKSGPPATIPNPANSVPLRAENNLKLMCCYLRFKEKASRVVVPADVTLNAVRKLCDHHNWEKAHKDTEAPKINSRDWPKTIEGIEEWLRGCLGVTGIPLAYVIRDDKLKTQTMDTQPRLTS